MLQPSVLVELGKDRRYGGLWAILWIKEELPEPTPLACATLSRELEQEQFFEHDSLATLELGGDNVGMLSLPDTVVGHAR